MIVLRDTKYLTTVVNAIFEYVLITKNINDEDYKIAAFDNFYGS